MTRDELYRLRRHQWARRAYGGHWERWTIPGPDEDDWFPVAICTLQGGEEVVSAGLMLQECEEWGKEG